MKNTRVILFALTAAILSACGSASSGDYATSDIHPFFEIAADGQDSVTCAAVFRGDSSSGPDLELTDGDTVSCSVGNVSVSMKAEKSLFSSAIEYRASSLPYSPTDAYSVRFERTKSGEALTSSSSLPGAMSISSPLWGAQITKGSPILATWVGATSDGVIATVTYELSSGGKAGFRSPKTAESNGTPGSLMILDYQISNSNAPVTAILRLTRQLSAQQGAQWQGRGSFTMSQYSEVPIFFMESASLLELEP